MKNLENFCTWNDATRFMNACFSFDNSSVEDRRDFLEKAIGLESPLELIMLAALQTARKVVDFDGGPNLGAFFSGRDTSEPLRYVTRVAVPIGVYRADIVFGMMSSPADHALRPVVVECDGFNYHDRTRDQACRDRARDRYMQRLGYLVARFAGDEIVERPFACAMEIIDLALCGVGRVDYDKHPPGGWPVFTRGYSSDMGAPPSLRMFDFQNRKPGIGTP